MLERYFLHVTIIITVSLYATCANEPVTIELPADESFNYTIVTSYPTLQIHIDDEVEDTNSYNKYETENEIILSPVFDVTQYKNECPPGKIVPRRPCEEEANLWEVHEESVPQKSTELCESFQDVIDKMMYYSCWVSPSVAQYASNLSTMYIQKYTDFPENITNPKLEARKQQYITSFDTVSKMKQALDLSEEVRKCYKSMSDGFTKVSFLEEYKAALNKSNVYFEIEKEQTSLIQFMGCYVPLVENLKMYIKEQNLENIFYSGNLANVVDLHLEDVIIPNQRDYLEDIRNKLEMQQRVDTLKKYVNPTFVAILLTVGLTGNLLLLSIFIKYKEMRTIANLMIMNLTLTDNISLLINLPTAYYRSTHYWHDKWGCRVFHFIRIIVVTVSTYSVVMISLQRFLAVKSFPKSGGYTIGNRTKTFLMATTVWMIGFLYGIPRLISSSIEEDMCRDSDPETIAVLVTTDLVFICIVPSLSIVVFSIFTASKIKASALNAPGERTGQQQLKKDRMLSAHVLTGLAVLFVVSYFPNFIFYFVTGKFESGLDNFTFAVIDTFVYYLQFTNTCLNPVALGIMSKNYRKYMMELIGDFKIIPPKLFEGQSTSIASVSTTESSI